MMDEGDPDNIAESVQDGTAAFEMYVQATGCQQSTVLDMTDMIRHWSFDLLVRAAVLKCCTLILYYIWRDDIGQSNRIARFCPT